MRTTRNSLFTLLTTSLLGALALVATTLPLAAQDSAADRPSGTFGSQVDVSEVLLDVLVTDKQGNVIIGLGPDDFVVEEDGKPQDVRSVSFYSNRRLAAPAPQQLAGELKIDTLPEDRYFILLFQDQRQLENETDVGMVRRQLDAARRAKQWAENKLLPNDWVAVASYDYKLKLQTDFTKDRRAIAKAIDSAMKGVDPENNWPSRAEAVAEPSLIDDLPQGADDMRKKTLRVYDAVSVLADAASEIRGRKNLVFFTTGFGQINNVGQYLPDPRYYPPMMQRLNDANVAAYMVDLTPLRVDHTMSDAMNQLAEETGGEYYFNFTNFETPLGKIVDENNGYYLLSYQSGHPVGESGFQKVRVRTKNPQFEVKSREGYVFGYGDPNPGLFERQGE